MLYSKQCAVGVVSDVKLYSLLCVQAEFCRVLHVVCGAWCSVCVVCSVGSVIHGM